MWLTERLNARNVWLAGPQPQGVLRASDKVSVSRWLVAQVSKPAVSPISKSAGLSNCRGASGFRNPRHSRLGSLRYDFVSGREGVLLLFILASPPGPRVNAVRFEEEDEDEKEEESISALKIGD